MAPTDKAESITTGRDNYGKVHVSLSVCETCPLGVAVKCVFLRSRRQA